MKKVKSKSPICQLFGTKTCPYPEKCNGIRRMCGFWQHCYGKKIIGSKSQRKIPK